MIFDESKLPLCDCELGFFIFLILGNLEQFFTHECRSRRPYRKVGQLVGWVEILCENSQSWSGVCAGVVRIGQIICMCW